MKFFAKFLVIICSILFSIQTFAIENNIDLVSLVKPSTVQIITSVKGSIGIPNFIFDYDKNTISSTTKINDFSSSTVSSSGEGVGFILSEDGIIVTHSEILVGTKNTLYGKTAEKYLNSINKNSGDVGYKNAYKIIFNYLKENSIENVTEQIKIVRPQTTGYDAKVLYTGTSYENDNAIALIKIEATKLPTIFLSDQQASLGEKVYLMSYPLVTSLISEPIFSEGIINTIQGTIYRSDISLSVESKGSPVVDQNGKVLGVLGLAGVIIPTISITNALTALGLKIKPGQYNTHFLAGLVYMIDNHCRLAIEEFIKAQDVNLDFPVQEYTKPKIDICNSIINSDQSRDTLWDEVVFMLKTNASSIYLWITALLLFIIFLFCNRYFLKRLRKDEQKINLILNEETTTGIKIEHDSNNLKVSTELPIKKTFDASESKLSEKTTKINSIFKKPEKIEVLTHLSSTPGVITEPKAIQPDDALVVIASFKTLSRPITQNRNETTELQKTIKTDLPPEKKEDMKIENYSPIVKRILKK